MLNLDFFDFPDENFEMTHFMEFGFFDRFSDFVFLQGAHFRSK